MTIWSRRSGMATRNQMTAGKHKFKRSLPIQMTADLNVLMLQTV
jgi:hypothetical protein